MNKIVTLVDILVQSGKRVPYVIIIWDLQDNSSQHSTCPRLGPVTSIHTLVVCAVCDVGCLLCVSLPGSSVGVALDRMCADCPPSHPSSGSGDIESGSYEENSPGN